MVDYVQTKAQFLARLQGNQPMTLLLRDLVETLFVEAADPVAAIEGVIGAGGATAQTLPQTTTTALEDIADAINTTGKFAGKMVINNTTSNLLLAADATAAGEWTDLGGTPVHTPV